MATISNPKGSYDNLAVNDECLFGLQQLLNSKWTFFLIEREKYNQVRDSSTNDAMVQKLQLTWADEFQFNVYNNDGSEYGST